MKKTKFILFTGVLLLFAISVKAQEETDFLDEYIENIETGNKAKNSARDIIEQKPNILSLRDSQKRKIAQGDKKREKIAAHLSEHKIPAEEMPLQDTEEKTINIENIANLYQTAPFGLYWGASLGDLQKLKFTFKPATRENYQNVYVVENPKQSVQNFNMVTAIFGLQDKLWCIYAKGKATKDLPNAANILKTYRKYYNALEKKYGNAQEFFTPYSYTQELIEGDAGQEKTVTKENPLGNNNFLQELKNNQATLYATFENGVIGVTLSVFVNADDESYITLDYKNLTLMQEHQENDFENLLNDL